MQLVSEDKNYSLSIDCPFSRIPKDFFDLPFNKMVEKIVGKKNHVSIVFVRESKIMALNKAYRGKDYPTDILSFPLEGGGEIFISINDARRKARERGEKIDTYLPFLLIHGLLHLKGLSHSAKMDIEEKKLWRVFISKNISKNEAIQNHSRNRHRHLQRASDSIRTRRRIRSS